VMAAKVLTYDVAHNFHARHIKAFLEYVVFSTAVSYLLWGGGLYHICRLGYLRRLRGHRGATPGELETIYEQPVAPALTILVPSYREEERVVRQTLLSAAMMEYPNRRIVLLIDDPPIASTPDAARALLAMRRLPARIESLLRPQKMKLERE